MKREEREILGVIASIIVTLVMTITLKARVNQPAARRSTL